ncbi:MAG TPA: type III-B CRISPR-associated protein Cas10/Cmr2 [Smithellaceae bacterium]|nr:type III-B CRISPR-associated protein Cas10/Cmr2 [Smithellaceae bacterium]HRS90266.1 type III-B CRISPR-associated protein Cas10/Cmr2 [Smithellaceae bacterium]
MGWQKPDISYWYEKFTAWWHDPIDKVFNIKGHESWAADYIELFGPQRPNESFWKVADAVAAGFERGQMPSYDEDERKSGAIDFYQKPFITHPISGKDGQLSIEGKFLPPEEIHKVAIDYLKKTVGMCASDSDLIGLFKGDEKEFAEARVLFTHLILRFLLAENNIADLGALWHRIPADSRFPDHSIWQHNSLCSAIYSCMGPMGILDNVGMMVFSITPVQSFISQARKLRDFWTGSIILSWLAFEGIRWIIENLGPDHVLYPSLIDQPLIGIYLQKKRGFKPEFLPCFWNNHPKSIASFPNKFVAMVPFDKVEDIAEEIRNFIADAWHEIAQYVCEYIGREFDLDEHENEHLKKLFNRQTSKYWDFRWAAVPLLEIGQKNNVEKLLDGKDWEQPERFFENAKKLIKSDYHKGASMGIFYSASHALVQKALAAEKSLKEVKRAPEPGEKCQLCGEFEVLHGTPYRGEEAKVYKDHIKSFWSKVRGDDPEGESDIKANERICSLCAIKRFLPRVMKTKRHEDHLLHDVFQGIRRFPSTTEMALYDYFMRNEISKDDDRKEIAQKLHEDGERISNQKAPKEKSLKNRDKYYAILLMDGDRMGDLVSGKTIAAKWLNVLHPDLPKRIKNSAFPKAYADFWREVGNETRLVTPAIHAAISEALGDFAIYGVPKIIEENGGRLVYAGGDDVCAFLPVSKAFSAAREIRNYYISVFRSIDNEGKSEPVNTNQKWVPRSGKLSVNLGLGEGVSISAAIVICHHKESLTQMLRRAHALLDGVAKEKVGRNACALELRKRGGSERLLAAKWDDDAWAALEDLAKLSGGDEKVVSHSLLYRLEKLKPGFDAVIGSGESDTLCRKHIEELISAQLARSGLSKEKERENNEKIVRSIRQLVLRKDKEGQTLFDALPLQIAAFMGGEDHE